MWPGQQETGSCCHLNFDESQFGAERRHKDLIFISEEHQQETEKGGVRRRGPVKFQFGREIVTEFETGVTGVGSTVMSTVGVAALTTSRWRG